MPFTILLATFKFTRPSHLVNCTKPSRLLIPNFKALIKNIFQTEETISWCIETSICSPSDQNLYHGIRTRSKRSASDVQPDLLLSLVHKNPNTHTASRKTRILYGYGKRRR